MLLGTRVIRSACIAAMFTAAMVGLNLPSLAEPEATRSTGSLHIEVSGLRSSQGSVVFALYDSAERYKKHTRAFRSSSQVITNQSCVWQVDDLPHGDYAVMLYHDENNNRKLDSNFFHVPQEPYGFSNNKRGLFGPASFGDTKFSLKESLKVLVIEVN